MKPYRTCCQPVQYWLLSSPTLAGLSFAVHTNSLGQFDSLHLVKSEGTERKIVSLSSTSLLHRNQNVIQNRGLS